MLRTDTLFLNREARRSIWEASRAFGLPLREGRFPKEKAATQVPASSSSRSALKDLSPLFLLRRFLGLLFGRLLLGFRFFCLFLWRGFLLRRFLGRLLRRWLWRGLWSGRFFLGLFADDHQLLFLGFDD